MSDSAGRYWDFNRGKLNIKLEGERAPGICSDANACYSNFVKFVWSAC